MTTDVSEGEACVSNMSPKARRVRARLARSAATAAAVGIGATVALGAPWWVRVLAFAPPATIAATAWFEAQSNVCIVRAAEGKFEHDDRSRTPMDAALMPAIRRVAATVTAKAALVGVAATVTAVLSTRVR